MLQGVSKGCIMIVSGIFGFEYTCLEADMQLPDLNERNI
jgi:hypothetical protein